MSRLPQNLPFVSFTARKKIPKRGNQYKIKKAAKNTRVSAVDQGRLLALSPGAGGLQHGPEVS